MQQVIKAYQWRLPYFHHKKNHQYEISFQTFPTNTTVLWNTKIKAIFFHLVNSDTYEEPNTEAITYTLIFLLILRAKDQIYSVN